MYKKPVVKYSSAILIDNFKRASLVPPNRLQVQFVTPAGKAVTMPTSPGVWAQIKGKPARNNQHTSYCVRHNDTFVGCIDKVEGVDTLVAVHVFPRYDFKPSTKPADLVDVTDITGTCDQATGEIVIKEMPLHIRPNDILRLCTEIDKLNELAPRQDIVPDRGISVISIIGGDFRLTALAPAETAVTTLSAAMS